MFVVFVKEYYKWLEDTGNVLYHSRRMLDYTDIDKTLDQFLPHFQAKYLVGTPISTVDNQRSLIKHSHELYRSKGTIESLRLIFNMLFGEEIDVYYPSDDILRASDGVWQTPRYLELSVTDRVADYIGRDVIGSVSGARAFVERVDRRSCSGSLVDIAFITDIRLGPTGSSFVYGELISEDGILVGAPSVTGSLTTVDVVQAGAGFDIGQDVDVVSSRAGIEGRARITAVGNRTGEVNYKLLEGGYGYTSNTANSTTTGTFGFTDIIVSANVLILQETVSTNTSIPTFKRFGTVTQPLANITFISANTTIPAGSLVYGINATANVVAAGYAIAANQTGANGTLTISPHTISSMDIDTVFFANTVTGSFNVGELVYQSNGSGNVAVGMVSVANSTHIIVDEAVGPFQSNLTIRGERSSAGANVAAVATYAYVANGWSNASITAVVLASTLNGGEVTAAVDRSATATVMGANSTAAGITNVSANPFVPSQKSWIVSTYSSGTIKSIINAVSTGTPGGFKIGAISNSEIVYINTDKIEPYTSLVVDDVAYGLPANTSAGFGSVIASALTKAPIAIGTISSLTERNPGLNNTNKPFAIEYQPSIAGYSKPSRVVLHSSNVNGSYVLGESVTQTVPLDRVTLSILDVTGTFSYNTHETVMQQRVSDGVVVYGEVYAVSSNTLSCYVGNTANTFDTSSPIIGITSGATANVANAVVGTINSFARGNIERIENGGQDITIHRTSFQDFKPGIAVYGSESGTNSMVISVAGVSTAEVMGLDAVVDPIAGVFDGTIATVQIVDSGILYQDGETVELTFDGHQTPAYGVARVVNNGQSQGRYVGARGTLDSTVKIQDNEYYQEYSYEIRSGIDRARYEDAVKSITHVAGTKMFNKYVSSTLATETIGSPSIAYDRITVLQLTTGNGAFVVGESVYQANGGSNTATGIVLSFDSTLNTLQLVESTGTFRSNTAVYGATSAVTRTPSNINITLL